jgi:hypothetical protein
MITFNANYRHATLFEFDISRQYTGALEVDSSYIMSLFPTRYDNLHDPKVILRVIIFLAFTVMFGLNTGNFIIAMVGHIKELFKTK